MPVSYTTYDFLAWDYNDDLFKTWRTTLTREALQRAIGRLIGKHRMGGRPYELCAPRKGAFNVHYRLKYMQPPDAIARFPIPAYFRNAEEKLDAEVAAMRYVADNTTIPVPFVLHYGTRDESPVDETGRSMGPFVVMEWVENTGDLCDLLNTPGLTRQDPPVLSPDMDEATLKHWYGAMADILLQMSQCTFKAIGALVDDDNGEGTFRVRRRPMTLNLSQLGNLGRVPESVLPAVETTYATATEYYRALADMHMQQLSFQRNDAVKSAADARKKYIARQLFRKLAAEDKLAGGTDAEKEKEEKRGEFPLWCDDLRPANVLIKAVDGALPALAAVIDWEYTYAAPADFVRCPPWWLLLVPPEEWKGGLDDWAVQYEPRLDTFLGCMADKGDAGQQLAEEMRQSWQTGQFWIVYAAQRAWAFDAIYWRFLDTKFYGPYPEGSIPEDVRLGELTAEQVAAMDGFVARKMREKEEKRLVDWYTSDEALPPDDIMSI